MPRVAINRLAKRRASVKRRRTSTIARAKFKPRTARANRTLIKSNAYAIRAIKRMMPKPVYTDWQHSGTLFADVADSPNFTQTIAVTQLTTPSIWNAVLRQDVNVVESSTTLVKRLQINMRYTMQNANWAQFTTFVVTLRPDAANRRPEQLVEGQDYILSTGQEFNARLNPAVFKVHFVRNVSLTKNTWLQPSATVGQVSFAGNPNTTFKKGQCTLHINMKLRQPTQGQSWTTMTASQLTPGQRYFLITFISQQSDVATQFSGARLDYDQLAVCYNAS